MNEKAFIGSPSSYFFTLVGILAYLMILLVVA